MSKYWKIFCEETKYPGLWQRWFKNQCVAAGFIPEEGYALEGKSIKAGWSKARNALKRMEQGDMVVVQLGGNRVARIGEVIRKQIRDDQWNPTVPRSKSLPYGGKGRQIAVRWDLNVGPNDADTVVLLPASHRLPPYVRWRRPGWSEKEPWAAPDDEVSLRWQPILHKFRATTSRAPTDRRAWR